VCHLFSPSEFISYIYIYVVALSSQDDYCSVCFTESIGSAPSIRLDCGHIFHFRCIQTFMRQKWNGPRISFGFGRCPLCKEDIQHVALSEEVAEFAKLFADVKVPYGSSCVLAVRTRHIERECVCVSVCTCV
jgi:Ring finger domain